MSIVLKKFPYKYMEYEKYMMRRELFSFFPNATITETADRILVDGLRTNDGTKRIKVESNKVRVRQAIGSIHVIQRMVFTSIKVSITRK